MILNILLTLVIFVIPILIILFFLIKAILRYKLSFLKLLSFFAGGILITPLVLYVERCLFKVSGINLNNALPILSLILGYGGIAIIEEISKLLVVYCLLGRKKYSYRAIDIILYLIFTALGFALVENILFAGQELINGSLLSQVFHTMGLRFIGANLMHLLCAIIVGLFLVQSTKFKNHKLFYLGLSISILVHTVFNIIIIKFGASTVLPATIPTSLMLFTAVCVFLVILNKRDLSFEVGLP